MEPENPKSREPREPENATSEVTNQKRDESHRRDERDHKPREPQEPENTTREVANQQREVRGEVGNQRTRPERTQTRKNLKSRTQIANKENQL
ncbi:hypothetical protein U1Q18_035860 [Sarracenia purpurea var. burkii]